MQLKKWSNYSNEDLDLCVAQFTHRVNRSIRIRGRCYWPIDLWINWALRDLRDTILSQMRNDKCQCAGLKSRYQIMRNACVNKIKTHILKQIQYTFRMMPSWIYLFDFNGYFEKICVNKIKKCDERMVKMVVNGNLLITNIFLKVFHHCCTMSSPLSWLLQSSFTAS